MKTCKIFILLGVVVLFLSSNSVALQMRAGTTFLAAADLKRNGVGYEIVPEIAYESMKSLKNYQTKLW